RAPLLLALDVVVEGVPGLLAVEAGLLVHGVVAGQVHLGGTDGTIHRDAVGARDALGAGDVLARLAQGTAEVLVVAGRGQQTRQRLVVDGGNLGGAQAGHPLPVVRAAVGHQVGGLVVDAGVVVHATVV